MVDPYQNSGAIIGQNLGPSNQYLPPGQTALMIDPGQQVGAGGAEAQWAQHAVFQQFQQMFGRNPTQSELSQFLPYFQSGDPNIGNTAGLGQAVSSYYNQQQQAAQAPQQEANALQQQIPILNDLIQQQTQAASKGLTDPNSPVYQQFSGMMNNMGITPSSGAFQSGLGGQIGQNANQALNAALGQVGLPIASGYSQGAMQPFQDAMSQPSQLFGNNLQLQDFLTQIQSAEGLANSNKPSDFEKYGMPLLGAGMQAGGQAAAGQLAGKPTWICTAMRKRGVITQFQINALHKHLYRAFWKRPFKFLGYILLGQFLVYLANKVRTNWFIWKDEFLTYPMQEPDPAKAVDLYAEAFWNLFRVVSNRLKGESHAVRQSV